MTISEQSFQEISIDLVLEYILNGRHVNATGFLPAIIPSGLLRFVLLKLLRYITLTCEQKHRI